MLLELDYIVHDSVNVNFHFVRYSFLITKELLSLQ